MIPFELMFICIALICFAGIVSAFAIAYKR